MRRIFIAFALIAAGIGAGIPIGRATKSPAQEKGLHLDIVDGGIYTARAVVDGDTIVLDNGLHCRINGINAPESGRFVRDYSPMAKEATAKCIELLEGKRIRVKLAPQHMDMHGRIVANVFVVSDDAGKEEINVREVMLKNGLAKVMNLGLPREEYEILKGWQDEAKVAEAGIWGIKKVPEKVEDLKPFCAASSSKTYHLCNCGMAKRISPANWHGYATSDEAEAAGLKPCATCLGKK